MQFPKQGRVRLKGKAYKDLIESVLERDGWQCRRCPSRTHLQVHHIIKRSYLRLDVSSNLCTLCAHCHELVERHKVDIIGTDADALLPAESALRFRPRT